MALSNTSPHPHPLLPHMFLDNLITYHFSLLTALTASCLRSKKVSTASLLLSLSGSSSSAAASSFNASYPGMVIRTTFAWELKICSTVNDLKLVTWWPGWMTKLSKRSAAVICFRFASNLRLNLELAVRARRTLLHFPECQEVLCEVFNKQGDGGCVSLCR